MLLNSRRFAGLAAVMLALLVSSPGTRAQDADKKTIVFVCQHGVVNSQMAAAYFNKIARERGLPSYGRLARHRQHLSVSSHPHRGRPCTRWPLTVQRPTRINGR